jgi:hypothetical protein
LKRLVNIFAWAFFGLSVLSLVTWPPMIWRHLKGGAPFVPAMLETLPYPIGAILFWIVARGLIPTLRLGDSRGIPESPVA